jgi:two-component system alkaline phosphatase synthesis response regulator PhoP
MENSEYTLLLVDDEPDILEFVGYNLKKEGFNVYSCGNGKEAIKKAREIIPDLILLDVMMPEMDGIETCEELRKIDTLNNTVIAMLTARGEDYSQIAGFDAGADDYITKPIKPKVLISRIKALLKRTERLNNPEKELTEFLQLNELKIDLEKYIVYIDNKELNLPKKEFKLLYLLASKPGKVFTREEIYSAVWGDNIIVGDRTIDVHIRKLREKLGDKYIKTIKGVGYKFND